MQNSLLAQKHLKKNRKYYKYTTIQKDKQNLREGDINSIVKKLCEPHNFQRIVQSCRPTRKHMDWVVVGGNSVSLRSAKDRVQLSVNSMHFFGKSRMEIAEKNGLKKEILKYINKMKQTCNKLKSRYQEYMQLSQETSDYLEYYLANFTGEDSGKAAELLKEQGKTIILLIFRKNFKCFQRNPPDINNRILLAFNLNPLNDFQFISWEKFIKMRKLIGCEFSRRQCNEFICDYFFLSEDKVLKGDQFWSIFKSVLRKLSVCLDGNGLDVLMEKVMEQGRKIIFQEEELTKQDLRQILINETLFIWHEFVTLIFS